MTVASAESEVNVAVMPVAGATPALVSSVETVAVSPGSTNPSPSPAWGVIVVVPAASFARPVAPTATRSARAITMPAPVSGSTPAASMSRALAAMAASSWPGVSEGFASSARAASAAASGAAAEVPKNGL